MSAVSVTCPNCAKELKAPNYLAGKKVVCPRCTDSFRVSSLPDSDDEAPPSVEPDGIAQGEADSTGSDEAGPSEPAAPPVQCAPGQAPPVPPAPVQVAPDKAWSIEDTPPQGIPIQTAPAQVTPVQTAPAQVTPVQTAPVQTAPVQTAPVQTAPAQVTPVQVASVPGVPDLDAPAVVTPVQVTPVSVPPLPDVPGSLPPASVPRIPTSPPRRAKRVGKAAKFIGSEVTETRVQLGADGQLPNLVLRDEKKKEVEDSPAQSSNPLLLIGVLCFSVTISVIMLFVNTENKHVDGKSKEQARAQIQESYTGKPPEDHTGPPPTIKPYQRKLREALQVHNLGDYTMERGRYREVLDMLHNESNQDAAGLTGFREAKKPPNDRHLKGLISTLLSED